MDSIVYQIEESNLGNNHEAYCPELLITGFGDTAEKARKALRREIGIYLEDCEGPVSYTHLTLPTNREV